MGEATRRLPGITRSFPRSIPQNRRSASTDRFDNGFPVSRMSTCSRSLRRLHFSFPSRCADSPRGANRERNGSASCLDRSLHSDVRRHGLGPGPHYVGILRPMVRARYRRRQRVGLQLSHFPAMPRCRLRNGLLLRESVPVSMPPDVSCYFVGPASTVRAARLGLHSVRLPPARPRSLDRLSPEYANKINNLRLGVHGADGAHLQLRHAVTPGAKGAQGSKNHPGRGNK